MLPGTTSNEGEGVRAAEGEGHRWCWPGECCDQRGPLLSFLMSFCFDQGMSDNCTTTVPERRFQDHTLVRSSLAVTARLAFIRKRSLCLVNGLSLRVAQVDDWSTLVRSWQLNASIAVRLYSCVSKLKRRAGITCRSVRAGSLS
jgi:hypothetical protein